MHIANIAYLYNGILLKIICLNIYYEWNKWKINRNTDYRQLDISFPYPFHLAQCKFLSLIIFPSDIMKLSILHLIWDFVPFPRHSQLSLWMSSFFSISLSQAFFIFSFLLARAVSFSLAKKSNFIYVSDACRWLMIL